MKFKDRVVLVTGGARGIGAATASRFAQEGARVVVSDMDLAPAEEVAGPIKGVAVACDVTSREEVEAMVGQAVCELGRRDGRVWCACIRRGTVLLTMRVEERN